MKRRANSGRKVSYHLGLDGRFVIENYNLAKPFSNFFPGIAGVWGIPMWVFYTNRAQCISSFGIEGKDKSIMEFEPANKAYRFTPFQGFHTFLKIKDASRVIFYEPFSNSEQNLSFDIRQKMYISSYDLTIQESNLSLGIDVEVNYFTLPNEPFAALVRRLSIVNRSRKNLKLELIDGMPQIVPYGLSDRLLKDMSRTIEAWFNVSNNEKKAPFYNLKVVVSDKPKVEHIKEGNFYFAFHYEKGKPILLEPIVDPTVVFGPVTGFGYPQSFYLEKNFKVPGEQYVEAKTPSAMGYLSFRLKREEYKTVNSLIGHISSKERLNEYIPKICEINYISSKADKNKEIIERLKNLAFTASSSTALNHYCEQTFVDNVIRGGLPFSLESHQGPVNFYVFSRKHGDPERDYNKFILSPTYLSQGNGSFRDINQNRRNDCWFNPDLKDSNVLSFFNLIQADGYNPLVIKGTSFVVDDLKGLEGIIKEHIEDKDRDSVRALIKKPFVPGEVLLFMEENDIRFKTRPKEFMKQLFAHCRKTEHAEHGEGFWIDHWTYNLDLLESYLAIYPEKLREILLEKKEFTFYQNDAYVVPRQNKYVLTEKGPRQYNAVAGKHEDLDLVSESLDLAANNDADKLRINNGKGRVYHVDLITKLLCIIINKVASLDPFGIGIEMEANKPGWYDALNGMPGLLGSSINETIELKRLAVFLRKSIEELGLAQDFEINIFEELFDFINGIEQLLIDEKRDFKYWDKSNTEKENYRQRIMRGISGVEKSLKISQVKNLLNLVIERTARSIGAAIDDSGICRTYFINEVVEYEVLKGNSKSDKTFIKPIKFKQKMLAPFLEGPVHYLRTEKDLSKARSLYNAIKKSDLYDRKLKMYKVNTYLSDETEEIGRAKIFPRGWLENESIWLHMEYKYLLEILRNGLCEEFYEDFKNLLVPFLEPKVYGRSIIENSSFIVSSAHSDSRLHGTGFVARLSGSTAELIHIWLIMNIGEVPFRMQGGNLILEFKPVLAKWLFSKKAHAYEYFDKGENKLKIKLPANTYAFNFLGSILVVYHNPKRKNTFGKDKANIIQTILTYNTNETVAVTSNIIYSPHSYDIRDRKIKRIDIVLD